MASAGVPARPAALAAAQHGILTRRQLFEAGVSPDVIDGMRRRGQLALVRRGVYRVGGAPITWRSEVMAACLATGGVASHGTAAVLHGWRSLGSAAPEVSVPVERSARTLGVAVHRVGDLHRGGLRRIDGIPVTGVGRTLLDVAGRLPAARLEGMVHDAIGDGRLSWLGLADVVEGHANRGREGVVALRRLVEAHLAGLVGDSVLESAWLALLQDAGLPLPSTQVVIRDEQGFIARVDGAYPDRGIAAELDSRLHHLTEQAFEADRAKRNRLRLAGWLVLEVTWRMVHETPRRCVAQVQRALDLRPPGCFGGMQR